MGTDTIILNLMEQRILEENREFRIKKSWSTELFNIDISENIKEYFNDFPIPNYNYNSTESKKDYEDNDDDIINIIKEDFEQQYANA